MMELLKTILLTVLLLGVKPQEGKELKTFSLIKRNEIYLYRPKFIEKPIAQVYHARPFFARLPTGEIFMIERGPGKGWGYFFGPDGELQRMIILSPSGTKARPGAITGINTIFATQDNQFGSFDNSNRLNLFDANGDFSNSILLPLTVNEGIIFTASLKYGKLAMGGPSMEDGHPFFAVFNLDPLIEPFYFNLDETAMIQAESKGKVAKPFVAKHICILPGGKVVGNVSTLPNIYIIKNDKTVIVGKTVPPHFHPITEAEELDSSVAFFNKEGRLNEEIEEWLTTWTFSYPPYTYNRNQLLIPRVLHPTFYLDLYSYSDEDITYLGYASTDKRFLYADSSGVYLLETQDDTSVVVGRYEIVTREFGEERESGWTTKRLSAEELTGIRKVPPDTSEPCPDCPREKHRPRGYCSKIDTVKLISADSVEYLLMDSLAPDKDHVILFGAPQDCPMFQAFQAAQSYVEENPGFDLTIVYTHPYPEELKEFMRLVRTQYDCLILNNIDRKRPTPILKSSVCFLVVSKDGTIVSSADYPDFVPKPR